MFEELIKTLDSVEATLKRTKDERKKISNLHLARLIAVFDKAIKQGKPDPLQAVKSSGEWLLSPYHSKNRFMLFYSIEQLKARVCVDVAELAVVAERVQWKEVQLWRS